MDIWTKAKSEYVSARSATLEATADKFGISRSTLRKRAAREKWSRDRAKVDKEVQKRTLEKIIKADATENSYRLKKIDSVNMAILKKIEKLAEKTENDGLTSKDIKSLSGALKDITSVLLAVNGGGTDDKSGGVVILPEVKGDGNE